MAVETIRWQNGKLSIIDQTLLPTVHKHIELPTLDSVVEAIRSLRVRGAPAIGVCAAFGLIVALDEARTRGDAAWRGVLKQASDRLAASRPTAVNLFWALDRMTRCADTLPPESGFESVRNALDSCAQKIMAEDQQLCEAIGRHGARVIAEASGVLTHCNAGALATSGCGTALAAMYAAASQGRRFHVYADETRPLLQGARLTAWELNQAGIPVTVICDSMAAQVMREGRIQTVIVGADRIASNGDAANKIGTYGLAVLAKAHAIPFYVAAPSSTFDAKARSGADIPIEQRSSAEILHSFGQPTAPEGVAAYNPAFDVTPATLIAGLITEHGILEPPYEKSISTYIFGNRSDSPVASE